MTNSDTVSCADMMVLIVIRLNICHAELFARRMSGDSASSSFNIFFLDSRLRGNDIIYIFYCWSNIAVTTLV